MAEPAQRPKISVVVVRVVAILMIDVVPVAAAYLAGVAIANQYPLADDLPSLRPGIQCPGSLAAVRLLAVDGANAGPVMDGQSAWAQAVIRGSPL